MPVLKKSPVYKEHFLSELIEASQPVVIHPFGIKGRVICTVIPFASVGILLRLSLKLLFGFWGISVRHKLDIETGKDILVAVFRTKGIIGKHTPVILVSHDFPKLRAAHVVFGVGIENDTEFHAVKFAGLEPDSQFLTFDKIFILELQPGILVAVVGDGLFRAVLVLHLFGAGMHVG